MSKKNRIMAKNSVLVHLVKPPFCIETMYTVRVYSLFLHLLHS